MADWSPHLALRPPLVALGFIAGIAAAHYLGSAFVTVLALPVAVLLLAARHWARQRCREGLVLLHRIIGLLVIFALGGIVQGARDRRAAQVPDLDGIPAENHRAVVELRGVVTRPAQARSFGDVVLRLEVDGTVVRVISAVAVAAGDEIVAVGRLRPPRGQRNPGSPDRWAAARADGIDAELIAQSVEKVGRSASPVLAIWRASGALRDRWLAAIGDGRASSSSGAIDGIRDGEARAVLRGITLGVRDGVSETLDERWRAVGIYHVLSVSGLHLAVVALLVFAAVRRLAAAIGTTADPALIAIGPALLIAVGYTMLTGAQVATLRALLIAALWMIAIAIGRPLRRIDALALAALVLLAWSPGQLWQPSFQLSFAAAIALTLPTRPEVGPDRRWSRRGLAWLVHGVTSSAWVALVTAPLTAFHFHRVQPGGVLGNLLITPLVELAALPMGLLGLITGELWPAAGSSLIGAAVAVVAVADALARALQPWCPVGTVAIASPLVAVALWAAATIVAAMLCRRAARSGWTAAAWAAMCGLWLLAPQSPPAGLRATFFDVGQGDAALIETASTTWLIDAGGAPGATTVAAASAPGRVIVRYLERSRRRRIDVAIISHPHPDHYLGLLALAVGDGVSIGELWIPAGFVDDRAWSDRHSIPSFAAVVQALRDRGTVVRTPPEFGRSSAEGAQLLVVAPRYRASAADPVQLAADPVRSVNDNSAVVIVEYAARRLLFSGDLESEGEDELLASVPAHRLRADIIKVPHHGSKTSSTAALVEAVGAQVAVISCGAGNRFGFPAAEVVQRWRESGAEILRTDRGGAVILEISQHGRISVTRP